MERANRRSPRWVGALIAVLAVCSLVTAARVMGASWGQIVWGALGCLASALALEFFTWLVTGGPLRLEKRPARDEDRPE